MTSAAEQAAPQPGQNRPLPELAPPSNLDFTIQSPRRSPVPRAVEDLTFDVKAVRITGATRYDADQLNRLTTAVIGKTVHLVDLIDVADQIEARYHQDGYLLTRAFIPTQSVSDGVFQISVVEGYVAAVAVQGGDSDSRARVESLLASVTQSRPLKLAVLEQALLTCNQLPGLAVSGLLRPSPTEPAASELVVSLTDLPVTASLSSDNYGAANTGRWTVGASANAPSPFGDGGQFGLDASVNPTDFEKRHSFSGRYAVPVPMAEDLTYSLSALSSHGQPGGTVANLMLITDSVTIGNRVSVPLLLSRQEKLTLDAGFTVQSADVHALGAPLSHDEWRVADLALSYQNSAWLDGVSNVTLDLAQGVPSLGASASDSVNLSRPGGRTDFTKISGQLRRNQPIAGDFSAALTINGQYSLSTLLTGEEISYGGNFIGRGYDPGSITGDIGIGESVELRYDLDAAALYADQAQLYSFFDNGHVWNHSGSLQHNQIASTGGGLRLTVLTNVSIGVEYGSVLIGVPGNDEGKHTSRVMINSSLRF